MNIVEHGTGAPLVLVPGIQGRWEYVQPAIEALAESFRVITFALCDEPSSGGRFDLAIGFDNYASQIEAALESANIDRAVICGISFGGLAAIRFAATRPAATRALVLASTPGPGWHLRRRHQIYARAPWLGGPFFLAEAPRRLGAELKAAFPTAAARRRFQRSQLQLLIRRPLSPSRMARRALLIPTADLLAWCDAVLAPTLIVTGEPGLDHVVPPDGSLEYLRLIRGARHVVLEGSGHLGTITRPEAFADAVARFARDSNDAAA